MKPVVIVGAGPVGLFLAALLAQEGANVQVLEARDRPESEGEGASENRFSGSRSIGIHPPALEALAEVGAASPLIEWGVTIRLAHVFLDGRAVGSLPLDGCPPPYPFVLTLPQGTTERVLRERLEAIAPGSLRWGAKVEAVSSRADGWALRLADGSTIEAGFLVGCDGRHSDTRSSLGVELRGRAHGHHYLMADLADSSGLGTDAAIFLGAAGVVESFPLPGGRRRWVARVNERPAAPHIGLLARLVAERTDRHLPVAGPAPVSAFTAETRLAAQLAGERWALAGDAAHVVSPIGGQGMNLGWLGARQLVACGAGSPRWRPRRYAALQGRRSRQAAWRARVNMSLGGVELPAALRTAAVRALLLPSAARPAARYFTMRGL